MPDGEGLDAHGRPLHPAPIVHAASMTTVERGFDMYSRWRLRLVLAFYAYVIVVIVPAAFAAQRLFDDGTAVGDAGAGWVVAVPPIVAFVPFVAFQVLRRPGPRYRTEEHLARREIDDFGTLLGHHVPRLASSSGRSGRVRGRVRGWVQAIAGTGVIALIVMASIRASVPAVGVVAAVFVAAALTRHRLRAAAHDGSAAITEANTFLHDTRLDLRTDTAWRAVHGGVHVRTHVELTGIIGGRPVELSSRADGTRADLVGVVPIRSTARFGLSEKDPRWKRWQGADERECFEQRFELVGTGAGDLPAGFVEAAVRFDRNLTLDVGDGRLVYRAGSDRIRPFHSIEGAVLFARYLVALASSLDDGAPAVSASEPRA